MSHRVTAPSNVPAAMKSSKSPLPTQKNAGSDLGFDAYVQAKALEKPAVQYIKGFNYECIVRVPFPQQSWLSNKEYARLPYQGELVKDGVALFSLNAGAYSVPVIDAEWDDQWFHVTGRVHPYTLTWTLEPENFPDLQEPCDYKVPLISAREEHYQP